ncbi:CesT family type III secretion system chaperone [Desulfovibrio sp. OttesenSCG-928-F20]|nr:CesT family type III secretion system chaperone [Desulfovibrio sp. OttesenSCG-928-F20]
MPEQHLRDLCARLQLPMPRANERGVYDLRFADGFVLLIHGTRHLLYLRGKVCALPHNADETDRLCCDLLRLSLGRTGQECGNALPHLALDEGEISLQMTLERDLPPDDFAEAVEFFMNLLEKWSQLATREQYQTVSAAGLMQGFLRP